MQIISKAPRLGPELNIHALSTRATGQPSAFLCLWLPSSPHQLVAVLEKVTGEDPTGGVHHALLHDVVVASSRGRVQRYLGNRAREQK